MIILRRDGMDSHVKVYPNPVSDILYINGVSANGLIEIYDMLGRLVKSVSNQNIVNEVSISDLLQGTYVVKIGTKTYKIQKI